MEPISRRQAITGVAGGILIVAPETAFGYPANSAVTFGVIGTGGRGVYTPQMVIDGAPQLNGSDAAAVTHAIEGARSHFKIPVRISSVSVVKPEALRVHIEVDALPGDVKARKAEIFIAVALDHAESHVLAGENKGRDIRHVAVAESMEKVGTVEKERRSEREVVVKLKSPGDLANLRLIAFVQEADGGEVIGASLLGAPIR